MRTRSASLGVVLFVTVPLMVGAVYLGLRYRALRQSAAWPAAQGRAALPRFLEDRQALRAAGVFDEAPARRADAGELLNPRLPFTGPAELVDGWNQRLRAAGAGPGPDLRIPDAAQKALGRPDWPAYQPDWQHLDTGWFAALARYDHWSRDHGPGGPRPAAPDPAARRPSLVNAPRPILSALIAWSKLRLLDGARRGDVAAASRDVRKLAQLLWSQDDLIGALVGTAVLRSESTFLAALKARGDAALAAGVVPLDPTLSERARRYLLAYAAYLDFRAPPDLRDRVLAGEGAGLGYCAAVSEALWRDLLVRPFLRHAYGREFAAQAAQAERVRRACGDLPVLSALADPDYIAPELEGQDFFAMAEPSDLRALGRGPVSTRTVLATPFLREAVGYILLSIASTSGVGAYESRAAPPAAAR